MEKTDYKKAAFEWLEKEVVEAQRSLTSFAKQNDESMVKYCSKKLGIIITIQALISVGGQ